LFKSYNDILQEATIEELEEEFLDARDKVSPCSENSSEPGHDCRDQEKHVFVLSESGKPIYALHGDEDSQAPMFGVMQVSLGFFVKNFFVFRIWIKAFCWILT
jgi:hypothetical protein